MAASKKPTGNVPLDFTAGVPLEALNNGVLVEGHVGDTAVVVGKHGGKIFAVGAKCSHYGAPLKNGLVTERGIHCPWHHACFRLHDGSVERAPAIDTISAFVPVVQDGVVVLRPNTQHSAPVSSQAPPSVTIVGLGAASLGAAATLRQLGYSHPIVAFGGEPHGFYDRIKLSKGFLAGAVQEDGLSINSSTLAGTSIEIHTGSVVAAIDAQQHTLRLSDGSHHPYHTLLLATGATPKRLDVPGAHKKHVHLLRSLDDAKQLRKNLRKGGRAVVVGASFIGLEAAASLRRQQMDVSVVAMDDGPPMAQVLGPVLAQKIAKEHTQEGVRIHRGRKVKSIADNHVMLDDGTPLPCDVVVMGVGVAPNTALAESAGLKVDNGIVCDGRLQTSDPHIFAAGDVAAYPFAPGQPPTRIEHWSVAMQMGRVAAHTMLGGTQRINTAPFFWSEHFSIKVRYVGHAPKGARAKTWGNPSAGPLAVALYDGDHVAAVATVECDPLSLEAEALLDREELKTTTAQIEALFTGALGQPA